jgi:hypothetical protein
MLRAILGPWHDFFSLVGTAAATLIGLMFVAASVGTGFFTEERQIGLRTLLSPTVVAFGVVLAACIVGVLPSPTWAVPALLLSCIGAPGFVYSVLVWRRMVRHGIAEKIDLEDRISRPNVCAGSCRRRFETWFGAFLPRLPEGSPRTLVIPVRRRTGVAARSHMDGLNLSRAWCFRALARAFPEADGRSSTMQDTAELHLAAALPRLTRSAQDSLIAKRSFATERMDALASSRRWNLSYWNFSA